MSERSYRCLDCHDVGIAIVFNPHFVREYRGVFDLEREDGKPAAGIRERIHRFWRNHPEWPNLGPVNGAALCACDCEQTQRLSLEIDKFKRGERLNKEKKNTPPGCGTYRWKRLDAPLWPGPVDDEIFRALSAFYAGNLF